MTAQLQRADDHVLRVYTLVNSAIMDFRSVKFIRIKIEQGFVKIEEASECRV